MRDVSGPLHGAVTKAKDFDRLEAAAPVMKQVVQILLYVCKEKKKETSKSFTK